MKLVAATLYALRVPFVESFNHSATERRWCDSVVVCVRNEAGTEGFGEGAPRSYVTGETVETMLDHLAGELWPLVAGREVPPVESLESLAAFVPETGLAGAIAPNAARAALELAVLDCALRRSGRGMATLLPPRRHCVTYSGVITAGPIARAVQHARQMRAIGLRDIKVKVGFDDDVARVTAVRAALGPAASLRLDANGAWSFERAVEVLNAVAPLAIAAVEQPLTRGPVEDLVHLRRATPIPVMVDESLVTRTDAEVLIAAGAADLFNVRISKCGGLARSLAIASEALAAGLGVQVGSQVGETAILSAAGRHLAAALPAVAFVEGSYGTLLLAEDVSVETVRFGHRGEAPILSGPGLGIRVVEERLRRRAVAVRELTSSSVTCELARGLAEER
jgi:L-Ala-D/L-Glu epimerase